MNETSMILSTMIPLQGFLCLWMAGLYWIGKRIGNWGIVDVGWASGMAVSAAILPWCVDAPVVWRAILGAGLMFVWAVRLASFIFIHRVFRAEEDGRYAKLKSHWGASANRKFFWFVFQPQAFLIALFMIPLYVVLQNPDPAFGFWDAAAIAIWVLSVGGESLADQQLSRWRNKPEHRGQTCRSGLWRYSRHPNYFFEWLHWFTYIALAGWGPLWGWTVLGPLAMFIFLFRITGIPHTERQALASRGEDYRRYQQTTSKFFPWPPKTSN